MSTTTAIVIGIVAGAAWALGVMVVVSLVRTRPRSMQLVGGDDDPVDPQGKADSRHGR